MEFVWINRRNEERLEKLGATKRVVVLAAPFQKFYDHVAQAKEEAARSTCEKLATLYVLGLRLRLRLSLRLRLRLRFLKRDRTGFKDLVSLKVL